MQPLFHGQYTTMNKDPQHWCPTHDCALEIYTTFSFCPQCESREKPTEISKEDLKIRWEAKYGTLEKWWVVPCTDDTYRFHVSRVDKPLRSRYVSEEETEIILNKYHLRIYTDYTGFLSVFAEWWPI